MTWKWGMIKDTCMGNVGHYRVLCRREGGGSVYTCTSI